MTPTITVSELAVLLVEPSDVQRRILAESLREAGIHHLEEAGTLADARERFRAMRPDLVISAMYLPDGTAEDFLLELRDEPATADQPFMLVSSVRDRGQLETLRQSGVMAILPKPFTADDLDRAVRASVDLLSEQELELDHVDITTLRFLLVDDSRMARSYLRRVFETLGAEHFVEAANGREAVEALHRSSFDLIVTDYNMPEMDGAELVRYVREQPQFLHLPILMISSRPDHASLAGVTQAGVDTICDKPFEPETARQTLLRLFS
ncbi:MAG: response regulator [Halorhodospira halophila]|uniref:response regulator transcription factor n=1 Tax=Halorhodospira halophila TaxID=1053 RepID=UPI0026EAA402|nr:response regulator [Halorhodospira halophila]MCC3749975.1 response regulator [Halorhodospira halophila]